MKCIYTDIHPMDMAINGTLVHLEKGDIFELDSIPNDKNTVIWPYSEPVVKATVQPPKKKKSRKGK